MDAHLTHPMLDYRLGWRWLLPLHDDDQVALIGFTDPEVAFCKQALFDVAVTEDATVATVWLVQDPPMRDIPDQDFARLHTVCIIGSRSVVATWRKGLAGRFAEIHDYALLPPHNPRVVIPLACLTGLRKPWRCIVLAGGWRGWQSLLKMLARIGFDWPLRSRVLCIASQSAHAWPQGARLAGLIGTAPTRPKTLPCIWVTRATTARPWFCLWGAHGRQF